MAWVAPVIGAAASIAGGLLSKSGNQETKMQRTQRKLVDSLLLSLQTGAGPFADLYKADPEAFEKSFVEPAKHKFKTQTAPQIRQQYNFSGQQRGTGLEDELTRAGVDLDVLLNQGYSDFQQQAMNRKQNTIANILGQGAGAPNQPSSGQTAMNALGGYLTSSGFSNSIADIFKNQREDQGKTTAVGYIPPRKGFEPGVGLGR